MKLLELKKVFSKDNGEVLGGVALLETVIGEKFWRGRGRSLNWQIEINSDYDFEEFKNIDEMHKVFTHFLAGKGRDVYQNNLNILLRKK